MSLQHSTLTLVIGLTLSCATYASPIAILDSFDSESLTASGSTNPSSPELSIGFKINFFGEELGESVFVNENGNITFSDPFSSYAHPDLSYSETERTIIAPFFADVESSVIYGTGFFDGYSAFSVNWIDVKSYEGDEDLLNSFQLILVDRQDDGLEGDFDIIFNYDNISWEFGSLSGGFSPLAGFSNPWGTVEEDFNDQLYELPGSGQPGAFLDGGPHALAFDSYNSDVQGRYIYEFRGGEFTNRPPEGIPEPTTLLLLGSGLLGLAFARRRVFNG